MEPYGNGTRTYGIETREPVTEHLDRYAARCANFVLVAPRIAVLAAHSAAEEAGNQPRASRDSKGRPLAG